jgi:DNA (cytosine-5)-methyltransferase 1
MRLRFVDLFCGIGGFHQALSEHADFIFACDKDEDCRDEYAENYGQIPSADIRDTWQNIGEHDILAAGFPCQPFSKSGSQLGFKDKIRGTLFEVINDIVGVHKPAVILLENVKNFGTHDAGNTLAIVTGALQDQNYHVKEYYYSPHDFGIPQIRERIFIVGLHKNKVGNYTEFKPPKKQQLAYSVEDIKDNDLKKSDFDKYAVTNEQKKIFDHWSKLVKAVLSSGKKFPSPTWSMEFGRTYSLDGKFPLYNRTNKELVDELKSEGIKASILAAKEDLIKLYPAYIRNLKGPIPEWKRRFIENNRKFWKENSNLVSKGWLKKTRTFNETNQKLEWHVGKDAKSEEQYDIMKWMIHLRPSGIRVSKLDHIPALVAIAQIPIIGPWGRKITPREAANAQSFKPDFEFHKSDSIAYKQLGNSVNVEVVRAVFNEILKLDINQKEVVAPDVEITMEKHVDFIE